MFDTNFKQPIMPKKDSQKVQVKEDFEEVNFEEKTIKEQFILDAKFLMNCTVVRRRLAPL